MKAFNYLDLPKPVPTRSYWAKWSYILLGLFHKLKSILLTRHGIAFGLHTKRTMGKGIKLKKVPNYLGVFGCVPKHFFVRNLNQVSPCISNTMNLYLH